MRISHMPVITITALSGALLLSGCADGSSEQAHPPKTTASHAAKSAHEKTSKTVQGSPVRTVASMTMPLDDYELSPTQYEDSQQATWARVRPCMVSVGFKNFNFQPTPVADGLEEHEDLRYGTYNLDDARAHGYRPGGDPASFSRSAAVGGEEPQFTAEEETALDGVSPERTDGEPKKVHKTATGETIPNDGCYGQALNEVTGNRSDAYLNDTLVEELDGQSYEKSLTDPKVKAAFAAWSACMKSTGYSYASPIDANNDPKWTGDTASKEEIQTATADTQCKAQTNLVSVWHTAEVGIEKTLIAEHADALTAVREMKEAVVRNSERVH